MIRWFLDRLRGLLPPFRMAAPRLPCGCVGRCRGKHLATCSHGPADEPGRWAWEVRETWGPVLKSGTESTAERAQERAHLERMVINSQRGWPRRSK